MKVIEVVEAFAKGHRKGSASGGRLRIKGDKLYNYSTVIAYWFNGIMLINDTKYSRTTSTHQNRLKRQNVDMLLVNEEVMNEVITNGGAYVDTIKRMLEEQ